AGVALRGPPAEAADRAEAVAPRAVGAGVVVAPGAPAPPRRPQRLPRRDRRRGGGGAAELHQGRPAALRPPPLGALGGDAAHLLDVDPMVGGVAQVEAVDVPLRHADGADALRRLRPAPFVLVVGVGGPGPGLPRPG